MDVGWTESYVRILTIGYAGQVWERYRDIQGSGTGNYVQ